MNEFVGLTVINFHIFISLIVLPVSLDAVETVTKAPRGWTPKSIGNPAVDTDKCGRKGLKSNVCDPDSIIDYTEAGQVDEQIIRLYNDTRCPCSLDVCKQRPGGFVIAVALVNGMLVDHADSTNRPLREIDKILNISRHFSYRLLQTWNLGRCKEDIVILYSRNDNVVYTVTNLEARKQLTDELVGEIAMKNQIYFSANKYSNAEGLLRIISDYRDVFLGLYKSEKVWQDSEVNEKAVDSSGFKICSSPLCFVLYSLLILATCFEV